MDLFGFELSKKKKGQEQNKSFVPPENHDGAVNIQHDQAMGGAVSQTHQLDAAYKDQADLINQYREMSKNPEVEAAIDDIVNEAIVFEADTKSVSLNLDSLEKYSENLKDKIREQFEYILQLLDFNFEGDDIFKKWYIDGQINYHIVVDKDKNPQTISELRQIDPRKLQKVREVIKDQDKTTNDPSVKIVDNVKEYYIYSEKRDQYSQQNNALKIHPDAVARSISGLMDKENQYVFSYLHKAIKPLNQLTTTEDSIVIYRLTRAPERRVFYIDTGKMPKSKAEQYIRSVMNKFKNKMVYDANRGEVKDSTRHLSMQEDYWLPRPEGQKGTEVDTLQSGQNLGELTDVMYFKKKLYNALKIPPSRITSEGGGQFNIGRASEISRDEVNFTKYIEKLRKQFATLFYYLLKTQLVLSKTINEEDWPEIRENIRFAFNSDSFFSELKQSEILEDRLGKLRDAVDQEGEHYSREWVQKNVLQMTDDEIEEQKKKIEEEKQQGKHDDSSGF